MINKDNEETKEEKIKNKKEIEKEIFDKISENHKDKPISLFPLVEQENKVVILTDKNRV